MAAGNPRDPEKDALAIRIDIIKTATTLSSAVAGIYTTFVLTHLETLPHDFAFGCLVVSTVSLVSVAFFGVIALGNQAYYVGRNEYGLSKEGRFSLRLIYGLLFLALLGTAGFAFTYTPPKKTADVEEAVKQYVKEYFDTTAKASLQKDVHDILNKELQLFSLQLNKEFRGVVEEHDKAIQQYIELTLKSHAREIVPEPNTKKVLAKKSRKAVSSRAR